MLRIFLLLMITLQMNCRALALDGFPPVTEKKLYASNDLRGKQAPALEVEKWLAGEKAPDTQGKVVLIDFWASWCPDCRRVIPQLNKYKKKFAQDLVVMGISDESAEAVNKFMEKQRIDFAIAVDPSAKMKTEVGVKGIPHVLIVSPDGIVRWQGYPESKEDLLTAKKIAQIIKASKSAR